MERVLIVAKTHMTNGACVSGLTRDTNKSIRLLNPNGSNQPEDSPYEVGQVWELEFHPRTNPEPPHVEDVIVTQEKYIGLSANLHKILLPRVPLWKGGPDTLFDGLVVFDRAKGYISKSKDIPSCSTGYWLPDNPLTLVQRSGKSYYTTRHKVSVGNKFYEVTLSIPYVGYAEPIQTLAEGTLIRVSLARWWKAADMPDKRCYLQLSGWYM